VRILFLTDGLFPFQIGGMQKHSSVLVKLLAERGLDLTVIHPGGKDFSVEKLKEQFGDLPNLKFIFVSFPAPGKIPGHYIRANRAYSKSAFKAVSNELTSFDLIYAQGFTGHFFIKKKSVVNYKAKILVNLHGFEMFQFTADLKTRLAYLLLKREAKFNLIHADYVYSFGGKLDLILNSLEIPDSKILQHANGIVDTWITDSPREHTVRTFVFIGRNERRKGLTELTSALQKIIAVTAHKLKFHFIGKIEDTEQLKSPDIQYHGEIRDSNQIISILDQCDCLVIPSYAEGMPTVILEAMARGLAIISTDVGAVSRMIDGNGILLDKPDPEKITAALRKVIDMNAEELDEWKQKSLNLVSEKFLWSKVVQEKINDFCRITGKKV
jgi:glycosyltransferase involved in cell wall biosynthesis